MTVLPDRVVEAGEAYQANRESLLRQIAAHDEQLALVNMGGGAKYVDRHRGRGKSGPHPASHPMLLRILLRVLWKRRLSGQGAGWRARATDTSMASTDGQ